MVVSFSGAGSFRECDRQTGTGPEENLAEVHYNLALIVAQRWTTNPKTAGMMIGMAACSAPGRPSGNT